MVEDAEDKAEKREKLIKKHADSLVRVEGPISIPKGMALTTAIEVLQRKAKYEEEVVAIQEPIHCFVWDGCIALEKALIELFGYAAQEATETFFGKIPPKMVAVDVGINETRKVPWGKFSLPGISGHVQTSYTRNAEGFVQFMITAEVKHKDEEKIKALIDLTRDIAIRESIYRSKAIQIKFRTSEGEPVALPMPKFMSLAKGPAIFRKELESIIEAYVMAPIRYSDQLRRDGVSLKRGTLLAGEYGTGKTLLANKVAMVAIENGWTYIYVKDVAELPDALRFAQGFMPAVVFGEDIDRSAGRERTDEVNEILNTLDGIGNKNDEIITLLTSNHAEKINAAMRRMGRINLTLKVETPDAEAAERLVRHYAGKRLAETENLIQAVDLLNGQIPAVIEETVKRSKLMAISRTNGDSTDIIGPDLVLAAKALLVEQNLYKPGPPDKHPVDQFATILGEAIGNAMKNSMGDPDGK